MLADNAVVGNNLDVMIITVFKTAIHLFALELIAKTKNVEDFFFLTSGMSI